MFLCIMKNIQTIFFSRFPEGSQNNPGQGSNQGNEGGNFDDGDDDLYS